MSPNAAALLYLVAGVLFILALRGLSSPESSRRGNAYGMIGMAIAIATTLGVAGPEGALSWGLIIGGIAIGGTIGATIARRIAMTAMPQLVAAFHSLVGLAAVFVAAAALNAPEAFGIGAPGAIYAQSLIEMSLGVAIGAITFSGSIIAFAKLDGRMSGKPILLPARHLINIALFAGLAGADRSLRTIGQPAAVLGHRHPVVPLRNSAYRSDRRRGHAGGHLDAELLFGLGRGRYRLYAVEFGADYNRGARRLVGRDPLLHHV